MESNIRARWGFSVLSGLGDVPGLDDSGLDHVPAFVREADSTAAEGFLLLGILCPEYSSLPRRVVEARALQYIMNCLAQVKVTLPWGSSSSSVADQTRDFLIGDGKSRLVPLEELALFLFGHEEEDRTVVSSWRWILCFLLPGSFRRRRLWFLGMAPAAGSVERLCDELMIG